MKALKIAMLASFAAAMLYANDAVINVFGLDTKKGAQEAFLKAGEANFRRSREEAGVVAMFALSKADEPRKNIVLEIYADEAGYRAHRASEHFKRFLKDSEDLLEHKTKFDLTPKFTLQKKLSDEALKRAHFRCAQIDVKPEDNAKFEEILIKEMRASLAKESGVLALFALVSDSAPHQWVFFEIYADEAAYEAHRQTPHFQEFLRDRGDMVTDFEGFALKNNYSFSKAKSGDF